MSSLLSCMNCGKTVPSSEAKFFAEVFLCESCQLQAVHFYQRLERELQFLQTIAKEAIRVALIERRFSFPEGPSGEVSKRAVLEAIVTMEEARHQPLQGNQWLSSPAPQTPAPLSLGNIPPSALTQGAPGSGGSPKGSPQG